MFNENNFLNKKSINELMQLIKDFPNEKTKIFSLLDFNKANSLFKVLDFSMKQEIIKELTTNKKRKFLNNLSIDDRIDFLENISKDFLKSLIKYLNYEEKKRTLISLGYPENSIGNFMIPYDLGIKMTWKVKESLDYIRKEIKNSDIIEIIYIIDNKGKLLYDIKIEEFLLVDPDTIVYDLMNKKHNESLKLTDTKKEATKIFSLNNRISLPIIDDQNYLLGIVIVDDILRGLSNENYKKYFQKIGEKKIFNQSYIQIPLYKLIKKRAGWLILLFIGEMFTTTVIQNFSNIIKKAVVLAIFIPLVVSSGGNSGAQASSLIIQAMALGEIKTKDWWIVIRREIICGFFLGTILGLTGFFRIIVWHNINLFNYGENWLLIGFSILLSLIGIVTWGTFSGSMLPFIIKKFGGNPATSSAPFVATLVDVVGLIIYFSISYFFLQGVLL
ncbi:magnesium transporter [Blattabacterium cuenoti]|uniref:magnesium transporter n=1 Tax=Blattabacterium cuenoti TaxID=1653831 RepID=UPI00163C8C60|nr:magnesium transporter [Blattabacterium cuenoti]